MPCTRRRSGTKYFIRVHKKHSLSYASSVQSAINQLLEKDLVAELNKKYSVTDKLFAMWINTIYGNKFNFV